MPHATATLAGQTLASADNYEVVEGNIYFPPDSINKEFFKSTSTQSRCPWKGLASYYTISVPGGAADVVDGAWYYPEPLSAAEKIKGYVAFYKNKVDIKTE